MERAQEGPCCVCGVTTTPRCSPCAGNGFDLFICGREHQKLIWFAHKRVCGVNSKPFRFPPLSKEEAETAQRLAAVPIPLVHTEDASLAQYLSHLTGRKEAEAIAIINSLPRAEAASVCSPDLFDNLLLCCYRSFLLLHRARQCQARHLPDGVQYKKEPPEQFEPHFLLGHCMDRFAYEVATLVGRPFKATRADFTRLFPCDEDWYIQFCHRLIVCASLRLRVAKRDVAHAASRSVKGAEEANGDLRYNEHLSFAFQQVVDVAESNKSKHFSPAMRETVRIA